MELSSRMRFASRQVSAIRSRQSLAELSLVLAAGFGAPVVVVVVVVVGLARDVVGGGIVVVVVVVAAGSRERFRLVSGAAGSGIGKRRSLGGGIGKGRGLSFRCSWSGNWSWTNLSGSASSES